MNDLLLTYTGVKNKMHFLEQSKYAEAMAKARPKAVP